jgi:hypothetical protein
MSSTLHAAMAFYFKNLSPSSLAPFTFDPVEFLFVAQKTRKYLNVWYGVSQLLLVQVVSMIFDMIHINQVQTPSSESNYIRQILIFVTCALGILTASFGLLVFTRLQSIGLVTNASILMERKWRKLFREKLELPNTFA